MSAANIHPVRGEMFIVLAYLHARAGIDFETQML
jgi:hypothetical protein